MDFNPFFDEYVNLVRQIDRTFEKVSNDYSAQVTCHLGCCDCCYALFDLSLVEALYIKACFDKRFAGEARSEILSRADKADRMVHRLKRQAFQDHEAGKSDEDIVEFMAGQRVRCPALSDRNECALYDIRPITCRLYGIPVEIGGYAHTCGKSGFVKGEAYQTVKMENVNRRLYEISFALAQSLNSRYARLAEMIVPLSMALLTDYSEDFLGVMPAPMEKGV